MLLGRLLSSSGLHIGVLVKLFGFPIRFKTTTTVTTSWFFVQTLYECLWRHGKNASGARIKRLPRVIHASNYHTLYYARYFFCISFCRPEVKDKSLLLFLQNARNRVSLVQLFISLSSSSYSPCSRHQTVKQNKN